MGIEVGGMIIGLIINVLQLESESLEQLFLPSLWCDITCCQTQPPAQDMFDHQLINPFTFLTSRLTLTMKYKDKITPVVVGCKDKRKWEPPKRE